MDLRDLTIIIIKMFEGPFFFFFSLILFSILFLGGEWRIGHCTVCIKKKKKNHEVSLSIRPLFVRVE